MNTFYIFIIRTILGAAMAVVIMRFFYPKVNPLWAAGLWPFMVAMAYALEYFRRKRSKQDRKTYH